MISSVNTTASTTRTYQYDPSGRLVAARGGGLTDEFFVYRDGTEPIAWSRGGVHQYYVYGSQRHVPDLIYEDTDGDVEIDNVYRVLTDERGSVRLVVSLAATPFIAQRIEYDVFGNPTFPVGGEAVQPFGFAGAIWMPHARFWHMGARDYDPAVGRWTSKDPIRFAGGTNLYVYCEGDPVNCIDTTGYWLHILAGAVAGAAASIVAQGAVGGFDNISWSGVAGSAVAGALFAAIGPGAGAFAASLDVGVGSVGVVGWAGAGAGSNVVGLTVTTMLDGGRTPSRDEVAGAIVCGAIAGPIGGMAAPRVPGLAMAIHPSGNLTIVDVLLNNIARSAPAVGFTVTRDAGSAIISSLPITVPGLD
jgi:RHS repeat-associated protein